MTKTYREWSADQAYLLPPSPHDWLPQGDLVYFLLDTVATLDLTPIFAHYERERRGQPPFHPRMMGTLLLYCYATGTRSSRRIMRRCHVDVACRVIVGSDIPDFRTISDFRKIHLARLETLFVEVLKLCALAGLARVGTIALDGTKVKANASRHKAMSYDRMKAEEERLKPEIAKLLSDAEATDQAEDVEHGPDRQGDERPEELARRQGRLAKILGAKKRLEERACIEAAEEAKRREAEGKPPATTPPAEAVPGPKDRINFTDPESRIMKASNKGWDQCGNAQAVCNEEQIILAADVTDQANDVRQTVPMVDQAQANLDAAGVQEPMKAMLGEAGHYSEANATALAGRGIEPYLATERLKHHEKIAAAPRGRIPAGLTPKQRMARRLRTKKGRAMYAKPKGMIEPIFGQLKQVLGFRQFSLRGLASNRGEWRLMATVDNLLNLWRHDQRDSDGGVILSDGSRIAPAIERCAPFEGDPGRIGASQEVTRRLRASEKVATAIRGRYSDELLEVGKGDWLKRRSCGACPSLPIDVPETIGAPRRSVSRRRRVVGSGMGIGSVRGSRVGSMR